MSNTGDRRDDEPREFADDAGAPAPERDTAVYDEPLVESPDGSSDSARDTTVTDASPAEPAEPVHDEREVPAAAPAESTTTPPAEPGPVGPGDTAVVEPAFVRPSHAPTSVEPPVGTGQADADPGAPVDDEPADQRSRLDEAVQRANAVPVASAHDDDGARDGETPEPVAAGSVRRETYVPPAAGGAAAGAATLANEPQAPQTVYVQAPTPPKAKTNRGFGLLVALIGTAAFALLYAGVSYLLFLGQVGGDATELFVQFLSRPIFWVPVIAMFVGFGLLAVIVNRGPWWTYAVFGLLVGVFVYFSYLGAALLTVRAWELTAQQAIDFVNSRWLDPLAIAAGVIAREIPIWFGGWIAKRGRGVAERNRLAMEAYDRELAAGPRPVSR